MSLDFSAIEEESNRRNLFALTFAERSHQFVKFCRSLDLEKDFVIVVGHLDVEMLATCRRLRLRAIGRLTIVGHFCMWR